MMMRGRVLPSGAALWVMVVILLLFCLCPAAPVHSRSLRDGVIRLHIVSNSDCESDEVDKTAVRHQILCLTGDWLREADDADTARRILRQKLPQLRQRAGAVVQQHPVSIRLEVRNLPTTTYAGGTMMPAGQYWVLYTVLGQGAGDNWWCVLYPSLCVMGCEDGEPMNEMGRKAPRSALAEWLGSRRPNDYVAALLGSMDPAGHFHPPITWFSSGR